MELFEFFKRSTKQPVLPIEKQIIKLLFMDSIIKEFPSEPWNPIEAKTKSGDNLLTIVFKAHSSDCKRIKSDIPLMIGIPNNFLNGILLDSQRVEIFGLQPKQISFFTELESHYLQPDGTQLKYTDGKSKTYLIGGGASIVTLIEEGKLSEIWKQGNRWLFIGQLLNSNTNIDLNIFESLSDCQHDGIMEVVKQELIPESLIVPVKHMDKLVTIDFRKMKGSLKLKELKLRSPLIGNGNFWVNCESLAKQFEITKEMLNSTWDPIAWRGKLINKVLEKYGIICFSNGNLCCVVPIWQILSNLNFKAVQVQ